MQLHSTSTHGRRAHKFNRFNYTFGPRVLAYSRNWSCPFKTEQNGLSIIIFVAFFVLPPIFKLQKRREMTVLGGFRPTPMLNHEINKE
ncbi:transmembrane protein, putative [Medicago truncatula]|uniref:Transmembrane protein, putative n=1 Tax=Medicago truncatula TaxID=3880 RepID=G7K572_MEDTR|nr:transmembrane protein, putative [Medicago truncatula]